MTWNNKNYIINNFVNYVKERRIECLIGLVYLLFIVPAYWFANIFIKFMFQVKFPDKILLNNVRMIVYAAYYYLVPVIIFVCTILAIKNKKKILFLIPIIYISAIFIQIFIPRTIISDIILYASIMLGVLLYLIINLKKH